MNFSKKNLLSRKAVAAYSVVLLCAIVAGVLLPSATYMFTSGNPSSKAGAPARSVSVLSKVGSTAEPVLVKHIILIVFENKNYTYLLSGINDPYIRDTLMTNYSTAADYHSIMHPSLTNYVSLIAGSPFNITSNEYKMDSLNERTIVDLLAEHNLTWKAYMESMPAVNATIGCANGLKDSNDSTNGPGYVHKHDPFVFFTTIMNNYTRCENIVPLTQFYTDLKDNELPAFSFITPNVTDDGHTLPHNNVTVCPPSGTMMQCTDNWLRTFMPQIINSQAFANTVVLITWDEAVPYNGPNKVLLLMVSPFSKKGFIDNTSVYSHFSTLATIEHIYSLGNFGRNDSTANVTSTLFIGNAIPSGV